jgi:hypothetical protein
MANLILTPEDDQLVANNPGVAKVVFSSASKQSQFRGEPVPASMPAEVGAASPVSLAADSCPSAGVPLGPRSRT